MCVCVSEREEESAQISARSMNVNKDLVKLIITPALNLESWLSERDEGGTFSFFRPWQKFTDVSDYSNF